MTVMFPLGCIYFFLPYLSQVGPICALLDQMLCHTLWTRLCISVACAGLSVILDVTHLPCWHCSVIREGLTPAGQQGMTPLKHADQIGAKSVVSAWPAQLAPQLALSAAALFVRDG